LLRVQPRGRLLQQPQALERIEVAVAFGRFAMD
jgi:hypothetical protein